MLYIEWWSRKSIWLKSSIVRGILSKGICNINKRQRDITATPKRAMQEERRPIKEFEALYEITRSWHVYSRRKEVHQA